MLPKFPHPLKTLQHSLAGGGRVWSDDEKLCFSLLQRISSPAPSSPFRGLSFLLQIHAFLFRRSLDGNNQIYTLLISSLSNIAAALSGGLPAASASALRHAHRTFDCRPVQDVLLCNSMIIALVRNRRYSESVVLYRDLRRTPSPEFHPNSYTFPFLLKSCSSLPKSVEQREGSQFHAHIVRMGYGSNVFVSTGLVDMYVKCGKLGAAGEVFDEMPVRSPASWTSLSVGYARNGETAGAMRMFQLMPEKDAAAFNAMIDVLMKSGDLCSAQKLFDEMPHRNVSSWTTLLSGYCKAGDTVNARQLLDEMPEKNIISWNAMIGGYNRNQKPHEALQLFRELQSYFDQFFPDEVTLASIIPAIAAIGAVNIGHWIHSYARRKGLDRATIVATALVDMYSKCGDVNEARKTFNSILKKETISWNALINGLALNGRAREALDTFMEMRRSGVSPDEVTMVGVLSACSHGGLVEEGRKWFKEMENLGIYRNVAHYGCLVDLLGRGGYLEEAEILIKTMPFAPNGIILSSLLFGCVSHRDVGKAERVIMMTSFVEPGNVRNYVMLRNLYAAENRWGDVELVEGIMRKLGWKGEAGCSAIEIGSSVSEFVAGDRVHPESERIYLVLKNLEDQMSVRRGGDEPEFVPLL
ncbi:Pentatricopeptide repeat-containing protein [Platanthera guangdongensis]|uniref:Pentatricopeptide repeat-containing protein n=1 Tax=Platanthera guangdongensis TaxID=2320717 RepID=A0ABR2LMN7_9ASPA